MGWLDYFTRVGRVDVVRLYDRGPAVLAWKIDQATGNQSKMTDYLPHYQEPEVDMPVSDVIKMFGGVKQRG